MNETNFDGSDNVPNLFSKLCSHLAKGDQALSAYLLKIALRFINRVNHDDAVDNFYVVTKIRDYLSSGASQETVKSFDLLNTKLQSMTIIQNKSAILLFLYELAQDQGLHKWSVPHDITSTAPINNIKSSYTFLPDDTKSGSVKKIYSLKSKMNSAQSSRTQISHSGSATWSNSDHDVQLYKSTSSSQCSSRTVYSTIPEITLMEEIIYCFQGIEGKVLRKEPGGLGFCIDLKISKNMSTIQKGLVERLANVGFLHNQIKQHCDESDRHVGLVGQSLVSSLTDELTSYYHLVSVLQAQLSKDTSNPRDKLTLRRMIVWIAEPQLRLQWLASIAEECNEKKGCALISAVHHFLQHGSVCVQQIATKVLSYLCRPLCVMLSNWLFNGELKDPYGEFFIEIRNVGKNSIERLWHDKYHIRKSMIPSFISMDQVRKILATGKSINFLRQVCLDNEELPGREALQKLFSTTPAEVLFSTEHSIVLHDTLEKVYKQTSLRVLHLLKEKYMMMEHLQALRKYLLLGQGDFIRHLLELLEPELNKSADQVSSYTLMAILLTAIHVTNAQFENETILSRLSIEIVQPSQQDIGWDVFALIYVIDGPIGVIFQPAMQSYKALFGVLWHAKRMEYVLSNLRKQQISNAKLLRKMIDLNPTAHMLYLCTSEMIHFLHQTQYYFLFEVLECSWAEMIRRVNHAECLDDVINAHNDFLKSVQSGMLVDSASYELGLNLRSIFTTILQFEAAQNSLFSAAFRENEARTKYEKKCQLEKEISVHDQRENSTRMAKFNEFLNAMKKQIKTLSVIYNSHVKKYLNSLATNADINLQLLSVRLNFNDYYKIF